MVDEKVMKYIAKLFERDLYTEVVLQGDCIKIIYDDKEYLIKVKEINEVKNKVNKI